MKPLLGMVIALSFEADRLVGRKKWCRAGGLSALPELNLKVIRSGVGVERASLAARRLVSEGVGALISVGVSAGLSADLMPGDIVVADEVLLVNESVDERQAIGTWKADAGYAFRVHEKLLSRGFSAHRGRILTLQEALLMDSDKSGLFNRFDALAVDMESAGIARAAAESGIPFVGLRAVCDPAMQSVPPMIYKAALNPDGNLQYVSLAGALMKKPGLIRYLVPMSLQHRAACRAMESAWSILHAEID